jgi:peptidoglycan/LPS O-acetylase OafA/YrhL
MKFFYRPEIDGLRAIAVCAVILYHAQINISGYELFKGGFIGVDIFFVISGYLITSIILKELVTTDSFSFKYFYERRIRRILPALLFVMLISLPFAWMYLLPYDLIDFSKSILFSLGFSSNFYFHYSGQLYGAENGLLKAFLHTWSLSVEEQFYILFPIVILFTFRYFKKYLIHILILGFVISIGLADWASRNHPSFNFYVLPTRGWELIAGSILAFFEITKGHRSKSKRLNVIFPIVGIILIIHSIFFFDDSMFHPSFYTLSPIAGVCLLIWFLDENVVLTRILSTKLFVSTGLISYSLYLWHYPTFAFARINELFDDNIIEKPIFVLITIILSIISYKLIEKPARKKKIKFNFILVQILFFYCILIILNFVIILNNGFYKNRTNEILSKDFPKNHLQYLKNSNNQICHDNIHGCRFNTDSNKKVFMIGDSHMASLIFDFKNRIVEKNYQFLTSTFGGCLYFPGFEKKVIKTKKLFGNCGDDYHKQLKRKLLKNKNSIIIFGGRLPLYIDNTFFNNQEGGIEDKDIKLKYYSSTKKYKNIQESFKNEITEISMNNKVILIYPFPEAGWHVPRKIFHSIPKKLVLLKNYFEPKNFITTSYKVYKERSKTSFELLDSIKGDNIYRVYPHTLFCDNIIKNRCLTHDDKDIFYFDTDHPSIKGAEMINDLIMKEIKKIELESN